MNLRSSLARLHDLIGADGPKSSWWRRALWHLVEIGPLTYQKMQDDKAPQMAAALTYHTLFSLLPTLVLTLVVAKAFVTEEQLRDLKGDAVTWTLQWLNTPADATGDAKGDATDESSGDAPARATPPSGAPVVQAGKTLGEAIPGAADDLPAAGATTKAPAPGAPSPFGSFLAAARQAAEQAQQEALQEVDQAAGERLKQEFNETAAKLDKSLQDLLDRLQNISLASIGTAGVLLFIWGATTLLSTIEQSFNFILRNPNGRPWHMRFVIYFTTLILAPLVLVAGQVGQQQLIAMLESGSLTTWIVPVAAGLSPLVTTWLVLFALYKLLPNGSMRFVPALVGSFVAALALGITTSLFGIYVSRTGTTSLYGAMALLPLFLLLLWIVWQIVLFGLEFATVLQRLPAHREATAWGRAEPMQARAALPDPRLLLPVAAELAAGFREGRTATPRELAQRVGIAPDTLQVLLDRLVRRGDAHRLPGDDPSYTLARPAEAIALPALLDETLALGRDGAERQAEAMLARLDAADRDALSGWTVADLLTGGPPSETAAASPPAPPELPSPAGGLPAGAALAVPARSPRGFRLPFLGRRKRLANSDAGAKDFDGRTEGNADGRVASAGPEAETAPKTETAPDGKTAPGPGTDANTEKHDTADAPKDAAAKGERGDLNPRPPGSQPGALTN